MKITYPTSIVAVGLFFLGSQVAGTDLAERVTVLETRVAALEEIHAAPGGDEAEETESSIVSVRLTRKEAQRENPGLNYYNLVFDVEFTGSKLLGERRIRDIKGTLFFDDVFGDEIVGATTTKRLGIGAGQDAEALLAEEDRARRTCAPVAVRIST